MDTQFATSFFRAMEIGLENWTQRINVTHLLFQAYNLGLAVLLEQVVKGLPKKRLNGGAALGRQLPELPGNLFREMTGDLLGSGRSGSDTSAPCPFRFTVVFRRRLRLDFERPARTACCGRDLSQISRLRKNTWR